DHLPGEHTPPPVARGRAQAGGISGGQRSGHARAGGKLLHAPGAGAAGLHAGSGTISVPSDGAGGGLRNARGVSVVAFVRAGSVSAHSSAASCSPRWTPAPSK